STKALAMTLPDDWRHDREIGVQLGATLDTTRVDDVRIGAVRPLISPALLLDDMPAPHHVSVYPGARPPHDLPTVPAGSHVGLSVKPGPPSPHAHDDQGVVGAAE